MRAARLIIADSEKNANLYYATKFLAPDPFVFLQINGRRMVVMSDLEVDRAKSQAKVDEVLSFTALAQQATQAGVNAPTMSDVVHALLRRHGITELEVPADFGLAQAEALRARGLTVTPTPDPFFPERLLKSEDEVARISESLRITEDAISGAVELIRSAEIKPDGALWLGGKPLTAELVRTTMHLTMMQRGCVAQHTIVAPGAQAVDPHQEGSGPLKANEPIVMDVFPQHAASRYFADLTRTIVRGRASDKVRRMFDAVKAGQAIAYGMIKDGADGSRIHQAILDSFEQQGFKTGEQGGRMQGFFHGTGHGVGLEIHEPPRISGKPDVLKAGMVVTVEPGLYYLDAGGMRIEDVVLVTPTGCRVLSQLPAILEL